MIKTIQSLLWTDYIYYALFDQQRFALLLEQKKSFLPMTFIVPALYVLFDVIAFSLFSVQSQIFYYKLSYGVFALLFIIFILQVSLASFAGFALSSGGVTPDIPRIFTILNIAYFPRLFVLPATLCAVSIHKYYAAPKLIYSIAQIITIIISLMISVRSLSLLHKISSFRSLIVLIFPFTLLAILLILIAFCSAFIIFQTLSLLI